MIKSLREYIPMNFLQWWRTVKEEVARGPQMQVEGSFSLKPTSQKHLY